MPARTPTNTELSSSYPLASSNIESIDYALYDFVNDELNIYCESNQGSQKVPVIFSTPERAFQIKNEQTLRKDNGRTINLPLITIKRTSMNKNPQNKGRYGVYVPPYFDFYNKGGSLEVARAVQQDKTKNFANSNAIRKSAGGDAVSRQTFETSLTTTLLGYLIGAGKNQKTPNVVIRESAAKIQIQRERSIIGDIPEFRTDRKDKYRP